MDLSSRLRDPKTLGGFIYSPYIVVGDSSTVNRYDS